MCKMKNVITRILDLGGCCVFWRKRRGKWVEREWRSQGLQQLRVLWPSLASPLASTSHDGWVFLSFPLDTSCIRWNVLQLASSQVFPTLEGWVLGLVSLVNQLIPFLFSIGKRFHDVVGNAYYVVLEVLKRKSGPKYDVWNNGVIRYILLCKRRPFWDKIEVSIFIKGVKIR